MQELESERWKKKGGGGDERKRKAEEEKEESCRRKSFIKHKRLGESFDGQ